MKQAAPPSIFAPARRRAARLRMLALQQREGAGRYVLDDMIEDAAERLGFLRHVPTKALVIGDHTGALAAQLAASGAVVTQVEPALGFDEESPFPSAGFDFIASFAALDTVNDLPGALIHMRNALVPGGLALASFIGAGSLTALREAMLAVDADRPAPRLHPMVDVRSGGQLLQRAGWADPVIDSRSLPGASERALDPDRAYSVDVTGSYRLSRNLDVTAGVRLQRENDRLAPLTDERQDSQAVYVGTQFRF